MPLPPARETIDFIQQDVLPSAGTAALIVCLFLILGKRMAALGSALAITLAFIVANFSFDNSIDHETGELVWWNTYRISPWKVEPTENLAWRWLPRAGLNLVIVGLLSRWMGLLVARFLPERRWWVANLLVWLPRVVAVVEFSGWMVSERIASSSPWLRSALILAMLLNWLILDGLARAQEGGDIAGSFALIFYGASAILIHAHSTQFMELAVILGSALFGIAAAANLAKADVSGAIPAGVVFLPGLVLGGMPTFDTQVPALSFWLVTFAPVMLAPFLIPFLSRMNAWWIRLIKVALVMVPLIVALALARQHERLPFEEEEACADFSYITGNCLPQPGSESCSFSPRLPMRSHPTLGSRLPS
jgi:hypothetical protein